MSSALELTPEKLAFIHGGAIQPSTSATVGAESIADAKLQERVAEPQQRAPGPRSESRRSRGSRETAAEPVQRDQLTMIPPLLVPLTTRLQPKTANALRRAYLEQKLRGQRPATQQEIIEAALEEWLRRHDYI